MLSKDVVNIGKVRQAVTQVVEILESRRLLAGTPTVQPLPISLNFQAPVTGSLIDSTGQGTGFTYAQPNKNGNEYQPALIRLVPSSDQLELTTTGTSAAGGSWEADNTLVNSLQDGFDATAGAFTVSTRLQGPLSYLSNPSEQGGIVFGPDDDNYIKLVASSTPNGQVLQMVDEQLAAGSTSYVHAIPVASSYTNIGSFSTITTLDLQLQANPATGIITGSYAINGGASVVLSQQLTLTGTEKTAFFSSTATAGLIAMAKNNLAPVTVAFDSFSIASSSPVTTPTPSGNKLTGSVIGTTGSYNNIGNTVAMAFDGNLNTYFDAPTSSGGWAGLLLSAPAVITQIKYAPRSGFASRMVGGIFQGSSTPDFSSGVVNLFTITATPPVGSLTAQTITNTTSFQYVRYLGPAGSYCNAAELEFDGTVTTTTPSAGTKLTGTVIGTAGSYNNAGNTASMAFDGNLNTFFDAPTSSGWAGLALTAPAVITQIKYAPRSSFASRMVGDIFQGSSTADFSSGVVNLFTVTAVPLVGSLTVQTISNSTPLSYVRYVGASGSYANAAEIEFDGTVTTTTPTPTPTPNKLIGTVIGTSGSYNNQGNTIANAFDGNFATYFDGPNSGNNYVGLAFSSTANITQVQYAPRVGFESRMIGGIFQASNSPTFATGVINLFTIGAAPTDGAFTMQSVDNAGSYEYVRYLAPAGSYGDIAELEFDGTLTGNQPPAVQHPSVSSSSPANGATGVDPTGFISCALNLPNVGAGCDAGTLSTTNIYLYRTFDGSIIPTEVNIDAVGSTIVLQPESPLDANTNYTFVITSGVQDTTGTSFVPYQISFTTGSQTAPSDPNIAFQKVALPTAVNQSFTCVTMGPDGDLYASDLAGDIFQFPVNSDGTLGNPNTILSSVTHNRLITGFAFDPSSTATNMTIWISSGDPAVSNAPDFSGTISTISGPNFSNDQVYITNLPRSNSNHLNDQPVFGPDGALYWCQGSNSSMGAPDSVWGYRPEHLLNAAILRLNIQAIEQRITSGLGPLDVQTDSLPTGQTAYNPYAAGAPLTLYATGIRNAYDLIWDSNGHLYAPTNGSAAGGNIPGTPAGVTPAAPALSNLAEAEDDYLYDIVNGGYYGHPDPARGQYIFGGANPVNPAPDTAIQSAYPLGTDPDPNYRGYAFDFGVHYSPDGSIEYTGNAFGGALNGALLITRYSGGKDIIVLRTGTSGQITESETGIAGFTGFTDPVDITEDPATGDLYVADLGTSTLQLLRPIASGASIAVSTTNLYFNDAQNGAASAAEAITISNTGNQPLAIPATGLSVTGTDGALFPIASKPALPSTIPAGGSITVTIVFDAGASALGLHTAQLQISSNDPVNPMMAVNLRAVTTGAATGTIQPSLQAVLNLFQIPDNVGTADATQSTFTTPPASPNDEVVMQELEKASAGNVTITPLASFGANITPSVGLGYYTAGTPDSRIGLFTVNAANSATISPVVAGSTSFDPGSIEFGLYGAFDAFTNPNTGTARISYSEDLFNTFDASNTRKIRFYPLKNPDGTVVPDAFVFAVEDAAAAPYTFTEFVGIIRNVMAAPAGPKIGTQNVAGSDNESAPSATQLVFSNIQTLNATTPEVVHNTSVLTLDNSGSLPLTINSIVLSNPAFTISTPLTYPLTIAAGTTVNCTLAYAPTHMGTSALDSGTLTINSNDPVTPSLVLQLTGIWQSAGVTAGGVSSEPTLQQIAGTFGYTTTIINAGQSLNQSGQITTAGQEILSTYWTRADANIPITVEQLGAFHTEGVASTLYWYNQGSSTSFNSIVSIPGDDAQSLLPYKTDATKLPAVGMFSPTGIFGLNVDKTEYSDNSLNKLASAADQGHHMRFYPVYDATGKLVPNTWLMAMDYTQDLGAYNDNVYFISNMRPAPPPTPTGTTAIGSISGITIGWSAVSDPILAGYGVYRSTNSKSGFTLINSSPVAGTSYLDTTATPGTTYYYIVAASDTFGGISGYSAFASAVRTKNTTAPAAPAGLTEVAATTGITLSWTANIESDLAGYNVYRSTSATGTYFLLNSSLLAQPTYIDSSAATDQVSFYHVTAVNLSGVSSAASAISATRPDSVAPAQPQTFAASGTAAAITLSWKANTESDLAGYNLFRSNSSTGTFVEINSGLITSLTYTDSSATVGFTSYYQLVAVDTSGNSSTAATANAFRPDSTAPAQPTGFTAAKGNPGIQLSWAANVEADLAGYNVYSSHAAAGPFTKLNTTPITALMYLDKVATAGTTTYYRLTAINTSAIESLPATTSLAI